MKQQYKWCNPVFGRKKIKAIEKVEYRRYRELIQVTIKEEVEVIKEDIGRIK